MRTAGEIASTTRSAARPVARDPQKLLISDRDGSTSNAKARQLTAARRQKFAGPNPAHQQWRVATVDFSAEIRAINQTNVEFDCINPTDITLDWSNV